MQDQEILILYIDFLQGDVSHLLKSLKNKNIVLRYKFMDCRDHNDKEFMKGITMNINPKKIKLPDTDLYQ